MSSRWGQILEETDSDGAPPPFRNWKLSAQWCTTETEGSESDMEVPPSKKLKVMEKAMEKESIEKPGKKKKQSVHEAIAAIQQGQMAASAYCNSRASEKQAKVARKEKV